MSIVDSVFYVVKSREEKKNKAKHADSKFCCLEFEHFCSNGGYDERCKL